MATHVEGVGNGHDNGILGDVSMDDAAQIMEQGKAALGDALETAANFVRERPIVCLAGALALGYLVGKIVSR